MGRLLRFLRPQLGLGLLALLLSFLAVAAQVGLIGTSAYLISRAALRPSTILLLMVPIVGVQFFSMGRAALRYLERLTSHDVTFRLLANLRVWFYARLDALPPAVLSRLHGADLLSRAVHDIDSLQDFYLRALAPPATLVLTAALTFALLWPMAPAVAGLVGGALLLSSVPAALQARLGLQLGRRMLERRGDLSAALADGVRGVSELLAYGQAEAYAEKLGRTQSAWLEAQLRLRRASAGGGALIGLLGNLTSIAALGLAIPLVRQGRLPGWDLAVLALVALAAFEAAAPLPLAFQAMGQCVAAGRRIFAVGGEAPDADGPPDRQAHAEGVEIDVQEISVRYGERPAPALRAVTLRLPPGRHVAVVGPSGAGKTTLLDVLTGAIAPTSGEVLFGGAPIGEIPRGELLAEVAVIAQDTWLFNVSLMENIRLGRPEATDREVLAAAQAAHLGPLIAALPDGLETAVGERGQRLSGGERQRVAIARAILKDAPVLLLDEATEGLDAVTEEAVLREILLFAQGRTLLMVTHRLVGLEAMDEILVLQDGQVVERGREQALLAGRGPYAHLRALQADILQEA